MGKRTQCKKDRSGPPPGGSRYRKKIEGRKVGTIPPHEFAGATSNPVPELRKGPLEKREEMVVDTIHDSHTVLKPVSGDGWRAHLFVRICNRDLGKRYPKEDEKLDCVLRRHSNATGWMVDRIRWTTK